MPGTIKLMRLNDPKGYKHLSKYVGPVYYKDAEERRKIINYWRCQFGVKMEQWAVQIRPDITNTQK